MLNAYLYVQRANTVSRITIPPYVPAVRLLPNTVKCADLDLFTTHDGLFGDRIRWHFQHS